MNKEEKISLEKLKNMAYDINCIGAKYCKIDEEDMTCNKCLRCAYDTISNYIDKLQKELDNCISKDKIRTEIKELEEILEKRKTIDIIEEINRLEELLGDE